MVMRAPQRHEYESGRERKRDDDTDGPPLIVYL